MTLDIQQSTFGDLAVLLLVVLVVGVGARRDVAAQGTVDAAALSTAGGMARGDTFTLVSSVGQASPVGETSQGTFTTSSGYLYTIFGAAREAPTVVPMPVANQAADREVTVTASVQSTAQIERAQLFYRRGGQRSFASVSMTASGGQLSGVIPAEAVTDQGVAYFLEVTDVFGRMVRSPASGVLSVQVDVSAPGLNRTLPSGTAESAYRILSVPLALDNRSPAAVLEDNLGAYDDTQWRFFELPFDQDVVEFPNTADLEPGRGFWIISREGGTIDTGPGTTTSLQQPYRVPLHPQWNLVGSPFNFPIPVEQIRLASGDPVALRAYDGQWNDPVNAVVAEMQPLEGYAVFNNRQTVDTLLIDPDLTAAAGKSHDGQPVHHVADVRWYVRIVAQAEGARDIDNVAAVSEAASAGWDALDWPEPPTVGRYVSVSFPHPEWGQLSAAYATDVRPEPQEGAVWTFDVESNLDAPVRLAFDGVRRVPQRFGTWLADEELGVSQDLRTAPSYQLAHVTDRPRRLKLVVGTPRFIERELGEIAAPQSFALLPTFPNPFSRSTTIRFGLPQDEQVTLRVYNLLGEVVTTLIDSERREARQHAVVWDGTNDEGQPVASGAYFVQLRAGSTLVTRKAVVVR